MISLRCFQEEVKYKQLINELKQKVILTKASSENRKQHLIRNLRRFHYQKIQIKKIAGDYTEWQSFEQSFDEAVHKNKKTKKNKYISNVERMINLFSLLERGGL